jgi:RNA polymerase sigma factor (sigma-70 family)
MIALTSEVPPPTECDRCRVAALAYHAELRSYIRVRFPSATDPDDIVQEVYLRFFRKDRGRIENVKAFLFACARNVAFDRHRREVRSPVIEASRELAYAVPSEAPPPPDLVARRQEIELLREAVQTLPPRCREVLRLSLEKHLTVREVAQAMAIAESTVEVQLCRAREHCQGFFALKGLGRFRPGSLARRKRQPASAVVA